MELCDIREAMARNDIRFILGALLLNQDDPVLARYGTRILTRLGERGFAVIEALLLTSMHGPSLSSISAAATAFGSAYKPSKQVIHRLFDVWHEYPTGGIFSLLEKQPQYIPIARLHALLKDPDRGEDCLQLLIKSRSWTGFGPAFRHLKNTADTSAFDIAEFAAINHPLLTGGGALLDLLECRSWPESIESQFVQAFGTHLPAKRALEGLGRLALSQYPHVATSARQALNGMGDHR